MFSTRAFPMVAAAFFCLAQACGGTQDPAEAPEPPEATDTPPEQSEPSPAAGAEPPPERGGDEALQTITAEFTRLFEHGSPRIEEAEIATWPAPEREAWSTLPAEVQLLSRLVGYDAQVTHRGETFLLDGAYAVAEIHATTGAFGRQRQGSPYSNVVVIGRDLYVDPTGQLGEPGGVYRGDPHDLAYDLSSGEQRADSLAAFLQACSR